MEVTLIPTSRGPRFALAMTPMPPPSALSGGPAPQHGSILHPSQQVIDCDAFTAATVPQESGEAASQTLKAHPSDPLAPPSTLSQDMSSVLSQDYSYFNQMLNGFEIIKTVGALTDAQEREIAMADALEAVTKIAEQAKDLVTKAEEREQQDNGEARSEDDGLSAAERELERCILENKEIPPGGKLGVLFHRHHPKGSEKHKEYAKTKGNVAKAAFRKRWAILHVKDAKKRNVIQNAEIEEIVDESCGVYHPFKVIWDKEGGDAAAFKAPPRIKSCHWVILHILNVCEELFTVVTIC